MLNLQIKELNATEEDFNILRFFVDSLGSASKQFRYFNSRDFKVLESHVYTILVLDNEIPIGYGHLDKEKDFIWLGISVIPNFHNKGVGKLIMNTLIQKAKILNLIEIYLTVDTDNINARMLYEKYNFKLISQTDIYCKYKLIV